MKTPMILAFATVLCAAPAISNPHPAQGGTSRLAPAPSSPVEKEPTVGETLAWLKEKLASSAFYKRVSGDQEESMTTVYKVTGVQFDGCSMTLEDSFSIAFSSDPRIRETLHQSKVSLGDLDPVRVRAYQLYKDDAAITSVQAYTAGDAPKVQMRRDAPGLLTREVEEKADTSVEVTFSEKGLAERAAKALTHAIRLCGAKHEPF